MSDRKVKVESTVRYGVVVSLPDFRFNRTFNRELQSSLIDFEIMEEGLQRPGFRNLFYDGVLRVVDKQDRIDLNLESEEDDDEIDTIISLTTKEIIGYLKGDSKALRNILHKINNDLLTRFVNVAVTSKISDYKVIDLINKEAKDRKLNIDMTALFKLASDAEKPVGEQTETE